MTTAYITHPVFRRHDMGEGHPECPDRLAAIEDRLIETGLMPLLSAYDAPEADRRVIERVHPAAYIDELEALAPREGRIALDPDTYMNPYTMEAARRAVGAAVLGVDLVMTQKARSVFCAVRPPGHHAERAHAMGFCFFNNVACAAMHALEHWGLSRVAVVDFDVHHGNGTEAIVAKESRVLFCSTFQHPFYPGTPVDYDNPGIVAVPLPAGARGMDFREVVSSSWFPALERFGPELILISAGFDAHQDDPLADLMLNERDFAWVTEQVVTIAERFSQGRVVSTLEGGYNLQALAQSVAAHLRVLSRIDGF